MRYFVAAMVLLAPLHAQPALNPWFGTWKLKLDDPREPPETLIYSDAGGGAMRMVSVEQNSIIITRFDGRPAPDQGSGKAKGNALAIRATSRTSYHWTFLRAGKPYAEGRNTLAADGRSFREVTWLVGKPEKTVTLTYRRQ